MGPGLGPAIFFCKGEDLFGLFYRSLSQEEEGYQIASCDPPIPSSTPAAQKSQSQSYSNLSITAQWGLLFLDLNQKDICTNIARGRTDPRVKSFCQSNCKNVCNKLLKLILAVVKLLLGCQLTQSYHQPFLNIRNNTIF